MQRATEQIDHQRQRIALVAIVVAAQRRDGDGDRVGAEERARAARRGLLPEPSFEAIIRQYITDQA